MLSHHFDRFVAEYEERFEREYGFFRPIVFTIPKMLRVFFKYNRAAEKGKSYLYPWLLYNDIGKEGRRMSGYFGPIEGQTLKNKYFRRVLFTGKYCQLVVMCLQPGEEIGNEVHARVDQFFRVEHGKARFILNGSEKHLVSANGAAIVPAGTYHNVINVSKTEPLKLYTVYSPPNHPDGTVHKTKAEAEAAEKHGHH